MQLYRLASIVVLCLAPSAWAQQVTLYSTDFTNLDGWTVTTGCTPGYEWAADATPASHPPGPYFSPPASLNFNNGTDIGGPGGHGGAPRTCGAVTSDPIDLSEAIGSPSLRFMCSANMEWGCHYDRLTLRILSATSGAELYSVLCMPEPPIWVLLEYPLEASWGAVQIEFFFDTLDDWFNDGSGPFIDDLEVVDVFTLFTTSCPGDGSGTACPCSNEGAPGEGCANSTGHGSVLVASGSPRITAGDLVLTATQMRPNQFSTFIQGNSSLNGGNGIVFGDGLRCAGDGLIRLERVLSDASGQANSTVNIGVVGGVFPGDTRTYQLWYRDPIGGPCDEKFNLTNGIEVTWVP
jgi:hypothetical protein